MRMTQQSTVRRAATITAALVGAILVPDAARAQRELPAVRVEVSAPVRDNARADTLEALAVQMYDQPRRWRAVARLHQRAARLRGSDRRAIESFRMAAWIYAAVKDFATARSMMEQAGAVAVQVGEIEQSANSYIDAAILAIAGGRDDRVAGLVGKTRALLLSPVLPGDARNTILRRIGDEPLLAQAWIAR